MTWTFHTEKMISKLPPLWNFNLTWSVHTDKMISTSPAPLQLQSDLDCHKDDDIKIATPWNFKLTWTVQHHLREVNMSFLVKRMQI